ncbi:MAG: 5'-3' exonuclease H3TH domain-containing protein [Patescibacteria group bacterium]
MKKLILIDSNALIHRAYHALPDLKTKQGRLVNAVYGFISILFRMIQDLKPDYLAATFDLAGPTFRDLKYQDYKAKRIKPPQEFYDQIPLIKELVKALNIPIYEKQGFEADDIIGTIVSQVENRPPAGGIKNIIITGDLDVLQLVNQQTQVYTLKRGITDIAIYDIKAVKERYGLKPEQMIDFKGLKGDPSDNIPGVPGIGEKTAIDLIKKFGSLEKLYQKLQESDLNPKLKARLLEYKDQAFFSRELVTIRKDVPISFDLEKSSWGKFNQIKVIKLLKKLEFQSLIKRLPMI